MVEDTEVTPSSRDELYARLRNFRPYLDTALQPLLDILLRPKRIIEVNLDFRLDNGNVVEATGWRVQHNHALGVMGGGTRIRFDVTLDELVKLATEQTIKNAVLEEGGAKGGIQFDLSTLDSEGDEAKKYLTQMLIHGYVEALIGNIGPRLDILGPDMNASPQIMRMMADAISRFTGEDGTQWVTGYEGAPLAGVRDQSTGQGVAHAALLTAKRYGLPTGTALAEGWGYVSGYAGHFLQAEAETKILGIKDQTPDRRVIAIFNGDGLDLQELAEHRRRYRTVEGFEGAEVVSEHEFWGLKADIAVMGATSHTFGQAEAEAFNGTLIVEGSNDPLKTIADQILAEKTVRRHKVRIVPDVTANVGGKAVSSMQVAASKGKVIPDHRAVGRLKRVIERGLSRDWDLMAARGIEDPRAAAYVSRISKVLEAERLGL